MTDPEAELAGLADFQRRTARYVFTRMYLDPDPATRFLVADEVGLGKTLVARAVVAQAIAHLREMGDRRIDIVYVCSNTAIARQNLRKLSPAGLADAATAGRLSLLPGQPWAQRDDVNLVALTPGTSLQHGTALGTLPERALALEFVASALGADAVERVGVYRAFAGNIAGRDGSLRELRERFANALGYLTPVWGAKKIFGRQFSTINAQYRAANGWWLREALDWLSDEFRKTSRRDPTANAARNEFIGYVRRAMAATGAELLRPDLVIFDEFQRFADLLHNTEPEIQPLIDSLLTGGGGTKNAEATRTLLLSATPYRMHTTDVERAAGEEDHYRDFLRTVAFLAGEQGARSVAVDLRRLRSALTRIPDDGLGPVTEATEAISARLRRVMVRTERLASTPDRDGMLRTATARVPAPDGEEIRGYLAAARLASHLPLAEGAREYDLVELWKSTPYLLSFLNRENYQVKAALHEAVQSAESPAGLTGELAGSAAALPWKDIESYAEVGPGNARLRVLRALAADPAAYRLLWLPSAAPYYSAGGPFEKPEARAFTKRLVFSAWHAVPNAVSAMLSYEVERATIGSRPGVTYTDAVNRATRPLRLDADTTYLLLYPSVALANAVDPLTLGSELASAGQPATLESVLSEARCVLRPQVDRLTAKHQDGPADPTWYWLAMLLLDAERSACGQVTAASAELVETGSGDEAEAYQSQMRRWQGIALSGEMPPNLGAPPDDLIDVLAEVALASPAVCALRAIGRVLPLAAPEKSLAAAARIASGFRAIFNGPEAGAIVASEDTAVFWRECLSYAARGNVQAVLDEYLHVLTEWQRFDADTIHDLAEHVHRAGTLRAVPYQVDVVDESGGLAPHRMRGRYATRFGRSRDEADGEVRAEHVTEAFNSPFWPFVLATTSIGQEGLDFHLYCHAVVHWNLPHNPVDLEQREGRVHRYKGHAVRKNVAQHCGLPADVNGDPWRAMFEAAAKHRPEGESEIVPYWVFSGSASIERHLLVAPYTRDASVLPHLLDSTAMYRIAFGQPRQEELLRGLARKLTPEQQSELAQIRVDLRPPQA